MEDDNISAAVFIDNSDSSGDTKLLCFGIGNRIVCEIPMSIGELRAVRDAIDRYINSIE